MSPPGAAPRGAPGAAGAKGRDVGRRSGQATGTRAVVTLLVALGCAGCGPRDVTAWDGRRGYDGNGDYGYDLDAARTQARAYQARAARYYPVPGTPDDPWGPYIRAASARFAVPETWVRAVMAQESGGSLYDAGGGLITSSAGAMGLMQVMPQTYEMLRRRYGLGDDPYAPRDNILAGTAYIREMYERYGAPGFLAAYNAGPDRVNAVRAGAAVLPAETVGYLASVAPRLGMPAVALSSDGGGEADRAFAGGGMTGAAYQALRQGLPAADDASLRAFDGGGLVTAGAPTGTMTPAAGNWAIQVGAFPDPARSKAAVAAARSLGGALLDEAEATIMPVQHAGILYRARLVGLSATTAAAACARLSEAGMPCLAVPP